MRKLFTVIHIRKLLLVAFFKRYSRALHGIREKKFTALGGPEKISYSIRQLQTPVTVVEFHADLKSGLDFDL